MPTMKKIDKFTYDLRERQSKIYDFLWRYAKEIKLQLPSGTRTIFIDSPEVFDNEIDCQMNIVDQYELRKSLNSMEEVLNKKNVSSNSKWITTVEELPTKNEEEIQMIMEDFTPRDGKVSILSELSPFLIKENDGCFWRAISTKPIYWRYKNEN